MVMVMPKKTPLLDKVVSIYEKGAYLSKVSSYKKEINQPSKEELKEIKRLMRKHGINKEVIIHNPDDKDSPYYIRDKKKIKFR
jgi:hypothetical protein